MVPVLLQTFYVNYFRWDLALVPWVLHASMYINIYLGSNKWGSEELVRHFVRGVFVKRPSLPKYVVTWDVAKVLSYLSSQSPTATLPLLALSSKLAMLLLLLSGKRGQTLHYIDIRNIRVESDKLLIRFGGLHNQSRPGYQVPELNLPAYPQFLVC